MSSETWKLERDLCRCCHAEGSFTSLAEPSHALSQAETLSEMLRRCFDIDIPSVEGKYNASTYTICKPCILKLRDARTFKQQVLQCEERFRDMFKNLRDIKEEYVEISDDEAVTAADRNEELKEEYFEISDDDAVAADDGNNELKEERFAMSDDDAVASDDGNDDTPLPKQPTLGTIDDETNEVKPQKEMKGPEVITSNVDLTKNTATYIKTREVNGKGRTNKSPHQRKRNQTPKILQNVFICNDCGKRFGNKRTLAVHIGSHEKLKQGKNLKCKECAYQAETQDALEQHYKLHDKNSGLVCDICGYKAKNKYSLLVHLESKNVHSGKMLRPSNICESRTNKMSNLKKQDQYLCSICGYKSKKRVNLTKHLRVHTGDKPYSCTFCEHRCSEKGSLTKHIRTHTGEKPYSCSSCDKKFAVKGHLKTHLLIHTGEKPYSCSRCDYKCTQKYKLKTHLLTHTGEKSYSCSFCEYKCAQKCSLKTHLLSHTGENPYSCSSCDYKCKIKGQLTRHLMTHTGEKPYSCSSCDYKCARKEHLTKHLRIHTGEKPYSCSFCEYKCASRGNLNTHLQMHTKPYSCSFCEYKSARKTYLTSHLRIHAGK